MSESTNTTIESHIKSHPVFLYMKGVPEAPACGFSHEVVSTLNQLDVPFGSFNVLEDWDVRESIKEYSNWPFIPQLYVDGKFVGGRDIVMEMAQKGDLQTLVEKYAVQS